MNLISKIFQKKQTLQPTKETFANYLKRVENAGKVGKVGALWYPHTSVEGGNDTIAYGHKLLDSEKEKFAKGITEDEACELLALDILHAYKVARRQSHNWAVLNEEQREICAEFVFNMGQIYKFPKFFMAVYNKQWDKAKEEYKRYATTGNGKVIELKNRNTEFYNRYLKDK